MNKKIFYYLSIIFILLPACLFAQADIHFSQFYETSILRNPALIGVTSDDYRVGAMYRNQWSSISNPYVTEMVTAETRISASKVNNDLFSFGALAYFDKAGSIDQKISAFYPAINYNKSLNEEHNTYLSVGFTGGYAQYSFDPTKATFNNQYQNNVFNANNPTGEIIPHDNVTLWDVGAGINLNSSSGENNKATYMIGVSGYHFSQPKISYTDVQDLRLSMRWNVNAMFTQQVSENVSMQAQGNFATEGSYTELMVGGLVGWNLVTVAASPVFAMYIGGFYRLGDAVIPTAKIKYKDLAFGVSYDLNVSTLKAATATRGGFEISLFKTGMYRDRYATKAKTVCPRFF